MKFKGHVISVDDNGDKLKVRVQAVGDTDAAWRPMNVIEFECASQPATGKSLYIGRRLSVEIKPL